MNDPTQEIKFKWVNPKFVEILKECETLIDDGSNIEYMRGQLEILASFIDNDGLHHMEKTMELAKFLNIPKENIKKMYFL